MHLDLLFVTSWTSETSAILKLFPGDCGNLKGRPGARFILRFFDLLTGSQD